MNKQFKSNPPAHLRRTGLHYALTPIMQGMLLGLSTFSAHPAMAAGSYAELQAENERQRQEMERQRLEMEHQREEIEALKRQLLGQARPQTASPAAEPANNAAQSEDALKVSEVPQTASSDDGSGATLGEVVVKRRSVLEKLKDTPKSVSVVTGRELEKFQANDMANILTRIGSVKWRSTNPRESSLSVRGIGHLGSASTAAAEGMDPSVGIVVDGDSYASIPLASSVSFSDLESVDVTRGPQGAQGGMHSSAARISIKTRAPSFTPEAEASIGYGQWNTLIAKAAAGGSIFDGLLAWRGSFLREQADSPFENAAQTNTYFNKDRTSGRLQFLLTPTDSFTARVKLDYTPAGGEYVTGQAGFYNRPTPAYYDSVDATGQRIAVNQANEPVGKLNRRWFKQEANYTYAGNYLRQRIEKSVVLPTLNKTEGAGINLDWDLGSHTLSSITGFHNYFFEFQSGQATVFDITRPPTAGKARQQQVSQELKIASKPGGLVDYQVGTYYLSFNRQHWGTNIRGGSDAGAYNANAAQYARLDADGNGRYLMINSLDRLVTETKNDFMGESRSIYANADWHLFEPLTVNSGLRLSWEHRQNVRSSIRIVDEGYGAELDPSSRNNVRLGGFNSNASGNLTSNNAAQLAVANFVAQKYFGIANYSALNNTQKQQVADAKAVRLASIGGLYQSTDAEAFDGMLPTVNISPSYKITDNHTTYFAWQHGEKAGVSQIVGATLNGGKTFTLKEEKTDSYEIGLKSTFFDKTLAINTTAFLQDVSDYIQPMYFYDEAQTIVNNNGLLAYTAGLGNVPKVQVKGLELDASYTGLPFTTIRFAGAYNDARYEDFKFSAKPAELGGTAVPYYDVSGRTLPGAAKFTFNLFAEYARPIFDDNEVHANVNYNYTSSYNPDISLSRYTVVDGYGLTDVAVGFGRRDKLFDVNLIVRNLFDTNYGNLSVWNSYKPSIPRWIGVTVSTQL
ncbi:TonB-dependent receptor plug domain-containing protein [Methylococcus sp. EFPC2]|uniref:TonB-dependent receptor plug domain-containing protein n=1 Tax=Methylococcus sp. EFPC2 TaxID=2812648 RepID=UPI0019677B62|nr:TonB-dependent receptor plug domain-containing protein [Methylococcus sp. EFPC2]QSA97382.1 TonB-dependent receptor plug domain-containing protein [Methylococcus sp. EFPC2]